MQYNRIWNFNAGPAALPLEVLEEINASWFNHQSTGMNIMEWSHRTKDFEAILNNAKDLISSLLGLKPDYHILFLQGGASLQFAMLPMNFLPENGVADYVNTGTWATKAIKEAKLFGKVNVAFDGKEINFTRIPNQNELKFTNGASYVHITSNNTIKGTQYRDYPNTNGVPLMVDMSSDILSHNIDANKCSVIYAGAQKNLGPSGVTVVILKDDFYQTAKQNLPSMLMYKTHVDENSLYNTPNTFGIYVMERVLNWIKNNGGLNGIHQLNEKKANLLYNFIDEHSDFYKGTVEKNSRSWMNACFRLPTEELEEKFVKASKSAGFVGVKGHRSVGGIRISMYNAVPYQAIVDLTNFMKDFIKTI